jgi:hypothetical protein
MSDTHKQDDIIDVEPKLIDEPKPQAARAQRSMWMSFIPPVAIALICAVGGGWFYRDWLSGYFPPEQVQELSKRVASIESTTRDNQKRVDAVVALTEELKAKLSAAQSAADRSAKQNSDTAAQMQNSANDLASLKQDVEKLSTVTAELQAKPPSSDTAADPALAQRLAQLEKQMAATPTIGPAAVVSDFTANLKTLKEQIAQGQGFAETLAPMARALPAAPGLEVLGAERAGLANAAALATELDSIRTSLPKPVVQPEETGWWASIKSVFSKFVHVRGSANGDWALVAAKASAFASANDLEQASALFTQQNSAPPPALKAWAEKAQRRLALDKATEAFAASLTRAGLAKE